MRICRAAFVLIALGSLAACSGDAAPSNDDAGSEGPGGGGGSADPGAGGGGGSSNATLQWREEPSLPGGRRQEVGVAEVGGRIFVVGGFDGAGRASRKVEVFDTATRAWADAAELPYALHHPNVAAVNGRVFVTGALTDGFGTDGRVLMLDVAANAWSERTPMPDGSARGASGVAVVGNRIYVAGGYRDGSRSDFSAYDVEADAWIPLPPIPASRDHLVAAAVGGIVYVIGGRNAGTLSARVDAYDPAHGWSQRVAMPTARAGSGAGVLLGQIVVAGGEGNPDDEHGIFPQTELFDPASNSWQQGPAMRTPRHGIAGITVAGVLYFPGGATVAGFGATDVMEALAR